MSLHCKGVVVQAKGVIRIQADGTIDMSTVSEYEMAIINDAPAVRKATRKLGKICNQIEARRRLGVYDKVNESGPNFSHWAIKNINTPVDEIDYTVFGSEIRRWGADASGMPHTIAAAIGASTILKVKIFPTSPVTI